jgi:lysyl-tRNA synthetase class 2
VARRARLEARARIRTAIRAWFEREGFLEVETPSRVFAPGQEVHLDAIGTDDGRYLITSPEYHMKRLLGAGYRRIFQLGRCYRAGESGPHHEPEFTMLEWYRAGEPLETIAADCEALVRLAAQAVGGGFEVPVPRCRAAAGGAGTLRLEEPFERATVRALLERYAGVSLVGDEPAPELREALAAAGHHVGSATAWDDLFFQVFLDRVEPHLGVGRPTFVFDWPAPLGALARRKADAPHLVERFELYAGGLELANAFGELTDAVEQRSRFSAETEIRRARGKPTYPIDERLLEALPRMPPSSGVALGFDRLVMLVTGASEIREVVTFANDEV